MPRDVSVAEKALDPEKVAVTVSGADAACNAVVEGVSDTTAEVDIDFAAEAVGIEVNELFAEVVEKGDAVDECDDEGVVDAVPRIETDTK